MNTPDNQNITIPFVYARGEFSACGKELADRLGTVFSDEIPQALFLRSDENGLSLVSGETAVSVDFSKLLRRTNQSNPHGELIVKAAKIKGNDNPTVIDATAGLGEDSFILAAAGFRVTLCEYNPVICALLEDGIERAKKTPGLSQAANRMTVYKGDSIKYMFSLNKSPDVVVLDPMFTERQKSALVKKKFQLLQQLERPCSNEEELLSAAIGVNPRKIVIKRPLKGAFLAGRKPDYSLSGKAIRYDVIFASQG